MAVAFVASVGMASAALTPVTKTLWAGQNIDAGNVTVSDDGTNINITYDTKDGWELTAYHVYVSTDAPPTKSAPGKFQYKNDSVPATTSITVQTITSPDCGVTIYIAAQAELQKYLYTTHEGVEIYQYESGWADGERIQPGKNWAMYFEVEPSLASSPDSL
ncbi:MAG: hypothetical protein KAT65_03205 [Methanophagales archaeon]|nr:hypothetical protein [Methanophagales archaeon]